MIKMNKLFLGFFVLAMLVGCKDKEVTTGIFSGIVTDATTSAALEGVQLIIFNANTNSPAGATKMTDADGMFSIELDPGTYYAKLAKQGYYSVPPRGISALPFEIFVDMEEVRDYELFAIEGATSFGWVTGQVTDGAVGVANVLVILEGADSYSSVTDNDGYYTINNVPGGTYQGKGWIAGYNSPGINVSVSANTESSGNNIALTAGATGVVSGSVKHLATGNIEVDVALVHPVTRETIPGLTGFTQQLLYTISDVPNGTYLARATFENDQRVMDPDAIAKFGEPVVTMPDPIDGSNVTIAFSVTNSVTLTSPTNVITSTIPVEVTSTTPTFEWVAYSSVSDYVIEVVDAASGNVIWGGFSNNGGTVTKNIIIPSSQTSAVYNYDGNATVASLVPGKIYSWRIYASKNVVSTGSWNLISASEDQMGLIKIVP